MVVSFYRWFIVLLVWLVVSPAYGQFVIPSGKKVLFLGDSITQDGRYLALMEAYLWGAYDDTQIDFINAGLSSETVSGITEPVHPYPRPNVHDRVDRALELAKPDWVVICYGMNDGIYHPIDDRIRGAYQKGLKDLVDKVAKTKAKVVLLTPPSFDIDAAPIQAALQKAKPDDPYGYRKPYVKYDETLHELCKEVQSLADHPGVERVVDVHAATDQYLQAMKAARSDYQYGDGVHPPVDGHLVMAVAALVGLGCDRGDVESTLFRLTGLAAANATHAVSADRIAFRDQLFKRFSARAAAYRKAIGLQSPVAAQAAALKTANEIAEGEERELRQAAHRLMNHASLLKRFERTAKAKWEKEIAALEKKNAQAQYPADAILFIGSSSIRLWDSIAEDVEPYTPIQRGYGGARYSDLAVFAERLIKPHQYQAIVVFVANDVTGGTIDHTPDEVRELAEHICNVSLAHHPDAPVFLVEITPTPSRFKHWSKIQAVNAELKSLAEANPAIHFIETSERYLDDAGKPIKDYFIKDQLHQNAKGYDLWGRLIKESLDKVLSPVAVAR